MKAMIFAAGLGTRLKPLTYKIPKALVPIAGKPLIEHIIMKLKNSGFNEIIVNVHHFPDQIIDFLKANNYFNIRIEVSDERHELLDTGGGIRKANWFFDDRKPFLVHNVDILSNIDLTALYNQHMINHSMATLVVSKRDTFRYLLFDENQKLAGWINEKTGEIKPENLIITQHYNKLAFSGIQILSPNVFGKMEKMGAKFPIMDFYLEHTTTETINCYIPDNYKMLDVGKLNILDEAERFIKAQSFE